MGRLAALNSARRRRERHDPEQQQRVIAPHLENCLTMWLTENPWPPIVICLALAAASFGVWYTQQRAKWLWCGAAALGLAVGCWFIEGWIVTEPEQVELLIVDLARSFENRDEERVLSYFSPQAQTWRMQATVAMRMLKLERLDIKDVQVQLVARGTEAISQFRANGRVTVSGHDAGHQPSRWKLNWRKEQGTWKIIDVVRLHPLKDEPMGILDRRAQ